jgi:1,2-diacylglycerol 3-beta-galactosyltransferase
MHLADFFIGKPGPGSISEALQMGLPAIIECNRKTMPQERYNATWLEEHELGLVLRDFKEIADAVRHLLADGRLDAFRENAKRLSNRAVYEVPDIFAEILEKS